MRHGIVPAPKPEKETHHDQNYRYSDRRPVRNRSIRTGACRVGLRIGFRSCGIGSSFGASRQRTGSQKTSQESQSSRIGFGIGRCIDSGASRSGTSSQQISQRQ
jgi:hypothetical protein